MIVLVLAAGAPCTAEPQAVGLAAADPKLPITVPVPDRDGRDWPVFLGPEHTGVSRETGLADSWPAGGPPVIWDKSIGAGYSAPSVLGNRLVVHHRVGDEEIVDCLRADDGSSIWTFHYPSDFSDPYGYNNGPRCTPLLHGDRCYTFGAEGKLLCLNLNTGAKIWMHDAAKEFELPNWFFGVGCTPILEGDLLIVLVGGQPNSGVVAFNAKSGDVVWKTGGEQTWEGAATGWRDQQKFRWDRDEQIVSYSSPIAVTIHGQRHVLCLLRHGLLSLDPQDGRERFKFGFRSRLHESVNAARPVVVDDKIFVSAAYNLGSALLQVDPDGSKFKVLWQDSENMQTHWSTAIHVDGYLYGFSGRHEQEGRLRCLDARTGKVVWETTGYEGDLDKIAQGPRGQIVDRATGNPVPWPFYGRGSKIQVENKFIVLGERGTLALVRVNPQKFEEVSRAAYPQITNPAWTAPVLSRKRLYLRDEDSLVCIDLTPPPIGKAAPTGARP
jgi:outer membrane protein assembly factor BamB